MHWVHMLGDAVLPSVCISDQYVETVSPYYCQLLPFWASLKVNQPANIQMKQKQAVAHLCIRGEGP